MQPTKPAASDAPTGIRVTFLDQTGAKSVEAMIAPPVTVARLIPNLITKLNLPVTGPDGQPMTYSLDHKEGGRRLRENETLVEAGVADGDHLIVYPEIVAGSGVRSPLPPSPRQRRLARDLEQLEQLASQSTIFSFSPHGPQPPGSPPESYRIHFRGRGLQTIGSGRKQRVQPIDDHEVLIQLVAEYPRSAPHMRWLTPIFHPNISSGGAVCLGGWGTHWAPSLQMDRLCEMLWDMLRMANYDTRSPFNPTAAQWLLSQRTFRLPLDHRELRDLAAPVPATWIRFDDDPALHDPALHDPALHDPALHEPSLHEPSLHEPSLHDPAPHEAVGSPAGDLSHNRHGGTPADPPPDILFLDLVR